MAATVSPPVALFVFNRYKDLPKTLEGLKGNSIEKLYVFSDGPRNQADKVLIDKVRRIIREIDWVDIEIVEYQANQGLSKSIQKGLDQVFAKHDRTIVIEDDIYVAPGFYKYMQQCLETYKDNSEVAGVTGLRYPFRRKHLPSDSDVFFAPRFSSWGWGTWKRFWEQVDFNRPSLVAKVETAGITPAEVAGKDLAPTYQAFASGELTGCWDVHCLLSILVNRQVFVWPTHNFIQNTGLSEGVHASGEETWSLEWEMGYNGTTYRLPQRAVHDQALLKDFVNYFSNHKGDIEMIKLAKKVRRKLITTIREGRPEPKPDPKDYTTTNGPMEVPCQKEAYFLALNKYMQDGDEVLDVGCGIGYGINLLSIKASDVKGVDVDPKAIEYCKEQIEGKNPRLTSLDIYDGYKLPYKDKQFDVVTTIDVLEHVEDYDRFIDELLRVTRRVVLFSTPNRRPENTNPDGTPKNYWHLREWSLEELDAIMQKHKAKVDWNFINGTWEGPFSISGKVVADTMTLTPALLVK